MENSKLTILWTNADPITSEFMVMMYAKAAIKNKFWEEVRVIIWGATSKLVAENINIQKLVAEAMEAGVEFSACQACAEALGTKQALLEQGIEMRFWGVPLTEIIKNKQDLITI